jgi:hypothetical protein
MACTSIGGWSDFVKIPDVFCFVDTPPILMLFMT